MPTHRTGERPNQRRPRLQKSHLLLAGLIAIGGGALLSIKQCTQHTAVLQRGPGQSSPTAPAPTLQAQVLDCDIMMEDKSCYPDPGAEHRVLLTGVGDAATEIWVDGVRLDSQPELIIDQGNKNESVFKLRLAATNKTYDVVVVSAGAKRSTSFSTFVPSIPKWLLLLWNSRYQTKVQNGASTIERELKLLKDHELDAEITRPGLAKSLYWSLRARDQEEAGSFRNGTADRIGRDDVMIQSYHTAIAAAQEAHVLSERNENVLWLCEYLHKRGNLKQADELLGSYEKAFVEDHRRTPYYLRQQAFQLSLRRGQHWNEAKDKLEQALIIAQRRDDERAALDVVMLGVDLLLAEGRIHAAVQWQTDRWKSRTPKQDSSPKMGCRLQESLLTELRILRVAEESEHTPNVPAGLRSAEDIKNQFREEETRCDKTLWNREFLADWTRLQLAKGNPTLAEPAVNEYVSEVERGRQSADERALISYLRGTLFLLQKRPDQATEEFQKLRKGSHVLRDEYAWHAAIGLARAAVMKGGKQAIEQAMEHYERAEMWLNVKAQSESLDLGKPSFLGQFERGTKHYLALLLSQGHKQKAMELIRRARIRGLAGYASHAPRLGNPTPNPQREKELADARQELVAAMIRRDGAAVNQEPFESSQVLTAYRKFATLAAAQFRDAGVAPVWDSSAMGGPREGEVLIACHPLPKDWQCLAQDRNGISETVLSSDDVNGLDPLKMESAEARALAAKQWSEKLLGPFADKVTAAKRVSFLAYGKLRLLDFHRLPFGPNGLTIQDTRQVIFAIDLPGYRKSGQDQLDDLAANMKHYGYLFGNEVDNRPVNPPVQESLRAVSLSIAAGGGSFRPNLVRSAPPADGPIPKPIELSHSVPSDAFGTQVAAADFLHVITHSPDKEQDVSERYLDLGGSERFFVSDILNLKKAPQWATILACGSGNTDAEWSNLDGMGLAQAFVFRGTRWVLGTERKVDTTLAARVSTEFYAELARYGDPFQALRRATSHHDMPNNPAQTQSQFDLAAFRLYAP